MVASAEMTPDRNNGDNTLKERHSAESGWLVVRLYVNTANISIMQGGRLRCIQMMFGLKGVFLSELLLKLHL